MIIPALVVGAAIKGIGAVTQSAIKNRAAKKEMEKQEQIAADRQAALEELEKNRQEVINPYQNITNEFENLGVATQAAKFQAEEADIALANTLDTIAATGGGAGGATALARMALESKRGISESIESQEAANQKARAQGANEVQQLKAEGEAFKFQSQEARDVTKQEQLYAEQLRAQNAADTARLAKLEAKTSAVGNVAGAFGDAVGGMDDFKIG